MDVRGRPRADPVRGRTDVVGPLAAAGLVGELFLTLSRLLAGRSTDDGRLSLVEGAEFLPDKEVGCKLLTLQQSGSHLFLRSELPRPG